MNQLPRHKKEYKRQNPNTITRDERLFNDYEKLISDLGGKARFMSKTYIYSQLAEMYYLSEDTVSWIIRSKLGKTSNQ